jgi:alpha-tubulin suppressor-like RCC1 family protein
MAINFPDSPSLNQIFADATTGFTYQWNGTVWVNYNVSAPAKILELDDISASFNGSTQTFALTVSSGAVTPVKENQLTINIGGVLQNPGIDYTISGSNITFTTAPTTGLSFYGVLLGGTTNLTEVSTGTVRPDSFTTGGPTWNTGGDLKVTGVTTIANTGSASTALYVSGNARVTGIVTIGSSSITIDGTNNSIKVGTGLTINSSGIIAGVVTATSFYGDGSSLSGVGVGSTASVNTTGIITASAFYGDGSNLSGVGVGTTANINTSGIITASYFYGSGIGITNAGPLGRISPISYSPAIGATGVDNGTNVVITFNKGLVAAAGTITLRSGSASGTIVESYDVQTSSQLSISGGVLTINPTDSSIGAGTTYFVVVPEGVYKDKLASSGNAGITTYSFTTATTFEQLFAVGYNFFGDLAQNNTTYYSSPVQIPGVQWNSVSAFMQYGAVCTKTDNTLWLWGYNSGYADLGLNDAADRSSPTQIPGTQWSSVAGGFNFTLGKKTDNTLWIWGRSEVGQLGQNDRAGRSSPIQIPGTQWNTFTGAHRFSLATKTDGTLWVWGANNEGQLGINDVIPRSSPAQIPGTQWSNLNGGYGHGVATKTDGTLWIWGRNGDGQLGQNDRVNYSSPRQVPGTQWNKVSAFWDSTLATKTDGTLWAFGRGAQAELAQNNTIAYSSPRQIPGTQWNNVEAGFLNGFATKTDGTLWSWGYNAFGQSGQNNKTYYSSPQQIPGTQWSSISASYRSFYARKSIT